MWLKRCFTTSSLFDSEASFLMGFSRVGSNPTPLIVFAPCISTPTSTIATRLFTLGSDTIVKSPFGEGGGYVRVLRCPVGGGRTFFDGVVNGGDGGA